MVFNIDQKQVVISFEAITKNQNFKFWSYKWNALTPDDIASST